MIVPRVASVKSAGLAASIAPESWCPPGPLPSWLLGVVVYGPRAVVSVCAWCLPRPDRDHLARVCPPDGLTTISHGLCADCGAVR